MRSNLLHEVKGQRTFATVLDAGEEVMDSLEGLAQRWGHSAAQITGIGAFR